MPDNDKTITAYTGLIRFQPLAIYLMEIENG
jgi:hypothetical protein